MITHLRKKDDPNKSYLYAYTEMLAMQPDMIPCDSRGNPVGAAGDVISGGMRPREAEKQSAELAIALEAIASLKAEVEALKGKNDPVTVSPEKVEPKEDMLPESIPQTEMSRNALYSSLMREYGKKAEYLKGNMSKKDLLEEAEKLQAAADLTKG